MVTSTAQGPKAKRVNVKIDLDRRDTHCTLFLSTTTLRPSRLSPTIFTLFFAALSVFFAALSVIDQLIMPSFFTTEEFASAILYKFRESTLVSRTVPPLPVEISDTTAAQIEWPEALEVLRCLALEICTDYKAVRRLPSWRFRVSRTIPREKLNLPYRAAYTADNYGRGVLDHHHSDVCAVESWVVILHSFSSCCLLSGCGREGWKLCSRTTVAKGCSISEVEFCSRAPLS